MNIANAIEPAQAILDNPKQYSKDALALAEAVVCCLTPHEPSESDKEWMMRKARSGFPFFHRESYLQGVEDTVKKFYHPPKVEKTA